MTEIRIAGGSNGTVRPWLSERVREARDAGIRVVFYVPEQYTLQAERDLIADLKLPGLLDLDVISPKKLRVRVKEFGGDSGRRTLDDFGRSMAIQYTVAAKEKELIYYRDMADMTGAVKEMNTALSELQESGVTPEQLEECAGQNGSGAARAKYHDLALIRRGYDELLEGRFNDAAAAWTETCGRLERSGLWQDAALFVYGFDTIRPDLRELLGRAASVCSSVTVGLVMKPETAPDGRIFELQRDSVLHTAEYLQGLGIRMTVTWIRDNRDAWGKPLRELEQLLFSRDALPLEEDPAPYITLYEAADPYAEARNATETLIRWNQEGIPWNRMAIALPGMAGESSMLHALLTRNGIPFFMNRKEPALRHGACRMLLGALDCVGNGYTTDRMISIARSGFSTLTEEEGRHLAEYAGAYGIERRKWKSPFVRGENAEEAEELRKRLIGPIEQLHDELLNAKDATSSVGAIVRFLEREQVYERLTERQERLAAEGLYDRVTVDRQIWRFLMELLDQLWALLDGRRARLKEISPLIRSALETAAVSAIPEEQTGVSVGEIGHMLPGDTDALLIMNMTEDAAPSPGKTLLTERERDRLEEYAGKRIGMNTERMLLQNRTDRYRAMTLPMKRLRISRSLKNEDGSPRQPDPLIGDLRRLFPRLSPEGGLSEKTAETLPRTPDAAMEDLADRIRALRNGEAEQLSRLWSEVLKCLLADPGRGKIADEMLRVADGETGEASIRPETAIALYGADRLSISREETYAVCPYQYFVEYGLRPVSAKKFEFSDGDAGNFFHAVLDRYFREASGEPDWPRMSDARMNEILDGIIREETAEWEDGPLKEDAMGVWQGNEYIRRVRHAAVTLTRFAGNSDFETYATELSFGMDDGGLPPLVLTLRDGTRVAFRGKIDRVDVCHTENGNFLRVVDNKSSTRKLSPAGVQEGKQLQLLLYLKAASEGIPGFKPAGAFYFPVMDKEITVDTDDPEAAEEARIKESRLDGILLADESVVRATDRDRNPYSIRKVFNQDGSISQPASAWVLQEAVFRSAMKAAEEKAVALAEDMRSGRIPVSPLCDGDDSPCTYCGHATKCRVSRAKKRTLPTDTTWRSLSVKNDLQEME